MAEIGLYHAEQGPDLEMGALQGRIQGDPEAVGRQPHAELDILDEGLLLAKAFRTFEDRPSDRPKSGPEGFGLEAPALMREMMQQIAILTYEILGAGLRVIRPEERRILRVPVEETCYSCQRIGMD